jgi:acetyl esterase/lipase
MLKYSRFLSLVSALFSGLTLIYTGNGLVQVLLWPFKLFAGSWVLFLAIAGGVGALLGIMQKDKKSFLLGLLGTVISLNHIQKVTKPHDGFISAFGDDWEKQIQPERSKFMLSSRYKPIRETPPKISWKRDVIYATHPETGEALFCDIWEPPASTQRTGMALIYIHGGGWHVGSKDRGTRYFFRHLVAQGHVIMDVEYTMAPYTDLFGMLADVKRAIAWIKVNADKYGVNPERIVLAGGSAGGHLALLAAYSADIPELTPEDIEIDTSVRGVISYYGLPDLEVIADRIQMTNGVGTYNRLRERIYTPIAGDPGFIFLNPIDMMVNLFGGTLDEVPERYKLGSPINHIGSHCPPTLLLQGDHDFAGMTQEVRLLHEKLREADVSTIYVEFPDTDHVFDLITPQVSPAAQAATYDVERFLAILL